MKNNLRHWRVIAAMLAFVFALGSAVIPQQASAGTTGTIHGVVTDSATGAPLANVSVTASSPSGTRTSKSDASGFYSVQALIPDTYTVSFLKEGYEPASVPGITVQQDLVATQNEALGKSLKQIANVRARGASNLVQPNVTSDVYTVNGAQLNAISGGDNLHKTLYEYVASIPGVTSSGFPAQPRIHGASITDVGYEFDGIPIKDRITGFFTTNLSNIGISNLEVFTGGLSAGDAAAGAGVINSVVKTGTFPGFGAVSVGMTAPDYNHYMTLEYGGATKDRKLSYYVGFDGVGSINHYDGGHTYPAILLDGFNGPGGVTTRDIIGNFHYKPDQNNDIQLLLQNGIGEFDYNYLLYRGAGQPSALAVAPCNGYTASTSTSTGASGGTAPNGASCPVGLYFSPLQQGQGNMWHHYSGIGKLQWNHIINDHSFFALRVAENFNQYIFDQPLAEYNAPSLGETNAPGCPALPYAKNTPVQVATNGSPCFYEWNNFSLAFYGDRRSNMWLGAFDYTNDINSKLTFKAGIGDEFDQNVYNYYYTSYFNGDGSWPGNSTQSHYPTHIPYAYASVAFKTGKFLLTPGLRYQRMAYDIPKGPVSTGVWNPTFAGTYTLTDRDVLRFSYTDSTSFVGSGYVYRDASSVYDPLKIANFSFEPTRIHSADLMLEHQLNYNTTVKFGPWMNKANNVFYLYRPPGGPQTPQNGGLRKAFGFEGALNHVDNRENGLSYWLSGTYDNYWTNMTSSLTASYNVTPLPDYILATTPAIRSSSNPLLSGSLTMDWHHGRYSLLPFVYYQTGTFYQTGACLPAGGPTPANPVRGCPRSGGGVLAPTLQASAYYKANLTALMRIGPLVREGAAEQSVIGVRITNLFNNTHDVAPCLSDGTGCYPFNGPQSGISGQPGYIYQDYTQDPRRFEFFFTHKW